MNQPGIIFDSRSAVEQVLGYLNFSSGSGDPQLLSNLDQLYRCLDITSSSSSPWQQLAEGLGTELNQLQQGNPAFQDTAQARTVLDLAMQRVVPQYLVFHRDLLFHQDERTLFNSFFLARVFEVVLQQGAPWQAHDEAVDAIIARLNDYIGYRPIAALESQKIEPYPHEWFCPIPLYVKGVGVAAGRYQSVLEETIELLWNTDPVVLRQAFFDPDCLDEIALDPRAYDFDHPVNKRPNHHFGQWDLHEIDNHGFYRRFVIQQVTLDALMARLEADHSIPAGQVHMEAAAVLAGTILMASGICGNGPDTHDSSVTLATLMPRIAGYRDAFYEQLLEQVQGDHKRRLQEESAARLQPFGGARQHLNGHLTRYRATQLEHVHLSHAFAQMGHSQPAIRHANVIPVAAARMRCQIVCRLSESRNALRRGDLDRAEELSSQVMDLVHRAIGCGAFIDPWNILGFDANFSLFPAIENTVHDQRADELVSLMDSIFTLYSEIWREAAASDGAAISQRIDQQFHATANWWRQFAAHEVSGVRAADPLETYRAARHVAEALNLWHKGGASSGDIRFWTPHAEIFDSPRAYSLVVEALLDRSDMIASMALLIHWLGESQRIGLEQSDSSWYSLCRRWLLIVVSDDLTENGQLPADRWKLIRKFNDYLEANASVYWDVPYFQLATDSTPQDRQDEADMLDDDELDPDDALFSAAYEHVTYQDTTNDGVDSELFEYGSNHEELVLAARQIEERLAFHECLADLRRIAALSQAVDLLRTSPRDADAELGFSQTLAGWLRHLERTRVGLDELMQVVRVHRIREPLGDQPSMLEYDRQRVIHETLLERIIASLIEVADTERLLRAAIASLQITDAPVEPSLQSGYSEAIPVFAAILRGEAETVRAHWDRWMDEIAGQPLLYVPLSKGGDPTQIVASRILQRSIIDLLAALPRLGLLLETCQLLEMARTLERQHPVGPGAVTEFDELFTIGFQAIVESLVRSSDEWEQPAEAEDDEPPLLVTILERLTEGLLVSWLAHSQTLRLSVLERVADKKVWQQLVSFISRYGDELFTQHFLAMGNIHGILLQGVGDWLDRLQQEGDDSIRLIAELDKEISRDEAVHHLWMVLEAIVENYHEYRDYNSTTTQSDHGELLYTLLDFLRLRNRYDRICWNLRPVTLAHKVLVQSGLEEAARLWREGLADRIDDEAEQYAKQLSGIQQQYAMRMQTVADRLGERFIRPMLIDQLRALVAPAMREAEQGGPAPRFELLEQEAGRLMQQPSGAGLDVPSWLTALEDEVAFQQNPGWRYEQEDRLSKIIPRVRISYPDALQQLDEWTDRAV